MKQVTKSPFSSPIYLGGKPIASESTKPNDLSSFFSDNCLFIVVHYHCVVYKGGNKSAIQTISYQYDWHSITHN